MHTYITLDLFSALSRCKVRDGDGDKDGKNDDGKNDDNNDDDGNNDDNNGDGVSFHNRR